ncbi:UDP-N-acetylmuramate dehydrogenase [Candidatus Regiella insecticola LSR1]|uniref:UDP-N-acetylenolpyruvoylglucosamine reductase n=1 Tax=Candidatus Regiella insecticola LSR1 TaxID=663321 RepID=E0WQT2_9ENTR|nr:UDP-N-acetylmuramate dehydrogenase [Candidatus Regiella insecticola]EFL92492.1 UDP-N-acetylmuramate dehydrogenase [Candidatus Regiella insecticola LSR1]
MLNQGTSLKNLNTFALSMYATKVLYADSISTLTNAWHEAKKAHQPVLLLGAGSNVLFVEDFSGTVLLNRIKGISHTDDSTTWYLHVGAGENWHQLVCYSLQNNMAGLENLALIPGCVGAAPIQNIGAYGVELENVCEYVDVLDLNTGINQRITAKDCRFGYRDSIFKHRYREGFAVVAVGIKLAKVWRPILNYGELNRLDPLTVTAKEIFNLVCTLRRNNLPDPTVNGNAGSFFKNPLVSKKRAIQLLKHYPNMPYYQQSDNSVKLAAGWLIDQCSLKGHRIGGAAVHQQQALVLINIDCAVAQDILALANYVRKQVASKFAVWLEPEVRYIAANGEINPKEYFS